MPTPLIFQGFACKMENGKNGGSQSDGWGTANSAQTLGAGDGIPYLTLETNPDFSFKGDDSITSNAFMSSSRIMGKALSKPLSFLDRYYGQDKLNYWMFGFENDPQAVVVFSASDTPWSTAEPAPGTVFVDVTTTEFTYLRREAIRDMDNLVSYVYIFSNVGLVLPDITSGVITEQGNTPTFTFTAHSTQFYEHLYELDKLGRRIRDYTTAEQAVTGWQAGDVKNIMMTMGRRLDSYDQRLKNAMCKSWNWKLAAADSATIEAGFIAYDRIRGDYASDTWSLPTGLEDIFSSPPSHETQFFLGTIFEGGSRDMVSLGMAESNITCEIPLDETQSYTSGVWFDTPILNAKYTLAMNGTINRHDAATYEELMDNNTYVCAQVISNMGYYMKEFLIKRATITKSGPDASPVAQEPLDLSIGYVPLASSPFTAAGHMYGNTEIQDSPIIMRVRNESAVNQMFAN